MTNTTKITLSLSENDVLERVTDRILTELPLADRVVYDLTPHPPRGEEWEG